MSALTLLIVGYGKMGRMVEEMAAGQDIQIVGRVDDGRDEWRPADVAVDFSTASALLTNFPKYMQSKMNVVIGTTGWHEHEAQMRQIARDAGIGVVAASNFSLGVALFQNLAEHAAKLFAAVEGYDPFIEEAHHNRKKDAPSGTALKLRDIMSVHLDGSISTSSTRAGYIPGTHRVGFDSEADQILLTHTARSRQGFASGALLAAHWIVGRTGVFEFGEVIDEIIANCRLPIAD